MAGRNPIYRILKANSHVLVPADIVKMFSQVSEQHVLKLAKQASSYINQNLPAAFENREGLSDYRTNPYVLMTSASVMKLEHPDSFASFLFNSKMYMALETSFGKLVESAFVEQYPAEGKAQWEAPPEKQAEFAALAGLSEEEKAQARVSSIWREIDKSFVSGNRRFLVSIKSGPNTINDSQVQAMTQAIIDNHKAWQTATAKTYKKALELDVVIGLTYGTDKTTNNKENQILIKLLGKGFKEEDREKKPGVLIDLSGNVRVYRRIGQHFWSFIADPLNERRCPQTFLEVLLALSKALSSKYLSADLEGRINKKLNDLANALRKLQFPRESLPKWVGKDFSDSELFWFATALTAFYDQGI